MDHVGTTRVPRLIAEEELLSVRADADRNADQRFGEQVTYSRPVKDNRNVAEVRGIEVSDGGRERSRTSDLYSVKERKKCQPE